MIMGRFVQSFRWLY